MQLTEESIKEFKDMYQKEFGIAISDAEADEMGLELLQLYKLLLNNN